MYRNSELITFSSHSSCLCGRNALDTKGLWVDYTMYSKDRALVVAAAKKTNGRLTDRERLSPTIISSRGNWYKKQLVTNRIENKRQSFINYFPYQSITSNSSDSFLRITIKETVDKTSCNPDDRIQLQ
jgi:hypothetical protein